MENTEGLAEQTILITGSTDGLGKQTARELAGKGAAILVHGRDAERAEATVSEIEEETGNGKLGYFVADLSSFEEVRKLGEEVRSHHHRLDVLIRGRVTVAVTRRNRFT